MVLYGLRVKKTGELAYVEYGGGGGTPFHNCQYSAYLTFYGEQPYMTTNLADAQATLNGVDEFKTSSATPRLGDYSKKELEVVEVLLSVKKVSV